MTEIGAADVRGLQISGYFGAKRASGQYPLHTFQQFGDEWAAFHVPKPLHFRL